MKTLVAVLALLIAACNLTPLPETPQTPTKPPISPTQPEPVPNPTPKPEQVGYIRACIVGLTPKLSSYTVFIRGEPLLATIERPCVTYPEPLAAGATAEVVVHGGAWGLTATPARQEIVIEAGATKTANIQLSWR